MSLMRRAAAAGSAAAVIAVLLAAPAACANRDALREIVENQCLVHWRQQHDPAPCEQVYAQDAAHADAGYAVLADRKGGAHFLLIPTATITGIESPALLASGAANYFEAAWQERARLSAKAGYDVPRQTVGLAVNPPHARSQDQLHIHIECLRPDVYRTLTRERARLGDSWTAIDLDGARYAARAVAGESLQGQNPFKLLASHPPQSATGMADYTLVVAGTQSDRGPGFIVLASTTAAGELLLDSTCAVASAKP